MTVRVVRARRDDRDAGPDGVEERVSRCRGTAVVGHLQDVHVRQASGDQGRVDVLLDVPGEQEPPTARLAKEDDRDVVDPGSAVRRLGRHHAGVGPQDG
jgi:hypothetical protein